MFFGVFSVFFRCFNPSDGTYVPLRGHVLYPLDGRYVPTDGTSFGLFVALFQMLFVFKYVISRLFVLSYLREIRKNGVKSLF